MGWQPIETAPRDGTHILIRSKARIIVGRRHNPSSRTDDILSVPGDWQQPATHWMPLPEAPDATSPASQVGVDHGSFSQEAKIPTEGREAAIVGDGPLGDLVLVKAPLRPTKEMIEAANEMADANGHLRQGPERVWRDMMAAWTGRQQAAQPDASQPVMSEANAPIPAVQSGAVAWRYRPVSPEKALRWTLTANHPGPLPPLNEGCRWEVQPLYAAPQSEPLPGGVGEADLAADLTAVASEIFERWDKDMRSGKLLTALSGLLADYDPRVTRIRKALAALSGKEQG